MTINILICLFIILIIIIIFLSFNDKIEPLETDKKNYNNYNNSGDDVSLDVDETEPSETPNEFIDNPPPPDMSNIENKPSNILSGLTPETMLRATESITSDKPNWKWNEALGDGKTARKVINILHGKLY